MLKSLGSFRVSLYELFLLVTGFAVGFALLSVSSETVHDSLNVCVVVVLLVSLARAMALPDRRAVLLSFVGGTLIFQMFVGIEVYNSFLGPLLDYIYGKFLPSDAGRNPYVERVAVLELALLAGVFCAWLTRSFKSAADTVGRPSDAASATKARLSLRDFLWLALVVAILSTWWWSHTVLVQRVDEYDRAFFDNPFR